MEAPYLEVVPKKEITLNLIALRYEMKIGRKRMFVEFSNGIIVEDKIEYIPITQVFRDGRGWKTELSIEAVRVRNPRQQQNAVQNMLNYYVVNPDYVVLVLLDTKTVKELL